MYFKWGNHLTPVIDQQFQVKREGNLTFILDQFRNNERARKSKLASKFISIPVFYFSFRLKCKLGRKYHLEFGSLCYLLSTLRQFNYTNQLNGHNWQWIHTVTKYQKKLIEYVRQTRLCGWIEIASLALEAGYNHDITRHGYNNERNVAWAVSVVNNSSASLICHLIE